MLQIKEVLDAPEAILKDNDNAFFVCKSQLYDLTISIK